MGDSQRYKYNTLIRKPSKAVAWFVKILEVLPQKGPRHKSHWVADWPAQPRWHQKPPKNVRPSEKNVQQSEKECLVIGEKCRDSAKCQEATEGYNWLPQMEHLSFLHWIRMKMRTRVFSEASLQSPIRQVLATPNRCQRPPCSNLSFQWVNPWLNISIRGWRTKSVIILNHALWLSFWLGNFVRQ